MHFAWRRPSPLLSVSPTRWRAALWLFVLLCWIFPLPVLPAPADIPSLKIDQQTNSVDIGANMVYLEDTQGSLKYADLLPTDARWQNMPPEASGMNFGYTKSTYWLRFTLDNTERHTLRRFLEIGYPVLDYLNIYVERNNKQIARYELGDKHPFSQRPVQNHNFVVPMDLAGKSLTQVTLQITTSSSMQVPATLWEVHTLMTHMQTQSIFHGIYYGAMIVLMLYNLFIFFTVRERKYLYYVFYIGAVCMFLASLNGITFEYFWPDATEWNDRSILFGLSWVIVFAGLFTVDFLELPKNLRPMSKIIHLVAMVAIAEALLTLFLPYRISVIMVISTAIFGIFCAILAGIILWHRGYRPAIFYSIAWFSFLLGGVVLALNKFNLLPRNLITEDAVQLGSALEGILLSIALADRLNQEKASRYLAQMETLEHERIARVAQAEALEQEKNARLAQGRALLHEKEAREAQSNALQIQQRANETLEEKVKQRTQALEVANYKLEKLTVTDGLTGIRNRRHFDKMLSESLEIAKNKQLSLALLMVDIDYFKRLNDKYGHLVGDDCLKLVALLLQSQVHRDDDVVARYGGEEFAILLPHTEPPGAAHIAEKIRSEIEKAPFTDEQHTINMSVSVGMYCVVPEASLTPHQMIEAADQALYDAKFNGRNRVCQYTAKERNST